MLFSTTIVFVNHEKMKKDFILDLLAGNKHLFLCFYQFIFRMYHAIVPCNYQISIFQVALQSAEHGTITTCNINLFTTIIYLNIQKG